MKNPLNKLTIILALAGGMAVSQAQTSVSYTNTYSISADHFQILNLNQFDPLLGTLTGVSFQLTDLLTGSFNVYNSAGSSATVHSSSDYGQFIFLGTGAPGTLSTSMLNPIPTTPATGFAGTAIPPTTSQTFLVTSTSLSPLAADLSSAASFFTGTGTVSGYVVDNFNVSVSGGSYSLDSALMTASGEAAITYFYSVTSTPEPSTLALAGLGGLGLWRQFRRRN